MKNKFKQISLDQAYEIIKRPITTEKSTNLQQFKEVKAKHLRVNMVLGKIPKEL